MKVLLFYLLLLAKNAYGTSFNRDLASDAEKYLLPGNISPVHYNLTIFTNIEKFIDGLDRTFLFSGFVEITVNVLVDNVSDIILHSYDDVEIISASIAPLELDEPAQSLTISGYDSETNKLILTPSLNLSKGKQYLLTVNYTGQNTDELTGFYRSSYFAGLQRRWLLVTDFESFGARRAFPCFDEPKYKATFQLTVIFNQTLAENGYVAHFNTDVQSETISNGHHITTFQKTPLPLSTYLVAFIVADFLSSPEPTFFNSSYNGENGTKPFRTIGQSRFFSPRQDLVSQVAGPAVLNIMTQKTQVGYGFNKVQQAGIPDFAAGAMENWGLVTYRENLLFWNEETGSTGRKQSVVTVTAHELSHQWFGDLVTLHWWSDLWLNEGFATYFEFHASDEIREPTLNTSSWDLIGQFLDSVTQETALLVDSFSYAKPLTYEVYDQKSIDEFFGATSYEKGGSVLRMWRHILSEDIFYAGLNLYLVSQGQGIGTPEILLASWDKAIEALPSAQRPQLPQPVAELFKNWHLLAGYPLLSVSRQGANITITQERFLWDGNDSSRWSVPISYSTNLEKNFDNTQPIAFLLENQNSTTIQLKNPLAAWFVLNNQATGYYRIDYDDENWEALIDALSNKTTAQEINEYNRAQIQDDLSTLTRPVGKSYRSYSLVLRLFTSLRHERSLVVWRTAIRTMLFLLNQLAEYEEIVLPLKAYFSWLIEPTFSELNLHIRPTDTHTQKLLRADIAKMALSLDLPAFHQQASQLLTEGTIHPDVRCVVLCWAVKNGGAGLWQQVLKLALQSEDSIKRDYLSALMCSSDSERLLKSSRIFEIEELLSESDKLGIIEAASQGNVQQAELALTLLTNMKLPRKRRNIKGILNNISHRLATEEASRKMEKIDKNAAKVIGTNVHWQESKPSEILMWLKAHPWQYLLRDDSTL